MGTHTRLGVSPVRFICKLILELHELSAFLRTTIHLYNAFSILYPRVQTRVQTYTGPPLHKRIYPAFLVVSNKGERQLLVRLNELESPTLQGPEKTSKSWLMEKNILSTLKTVIEPWAIQIFMRISFS